MKLPDRLSVHSINRVERTIGGLCLGFMIATFCTTVLPGLLQQWSEDEHRTQLFLRLPPMFGFWTVSIQVIYITATVCARAMWARSSGLFTSQSRGSSGFMAVLLVWLYYVALPVYWNLIHPVSMLWIGLWFVPWVVVYRILKCDCAESRSTGELRSALSPSWPAGTLGAEPYQIGSVIDELYIIIVREITDPGLLRVLASHLGIKSFRLLPECGFVPVLCDEHPRLRSLFPDFVKTSIDETEFKAIGLVVNQWGIRSERPWHGILDDATVLVHNESETRIVAPDSETFERYRGVLREHGREAGLGRFYLQMQGGSIVEYCEVQESLSGVEVSPVQG